jgi:hypothetical protein
MGTEPHKRADVCPSRGTAAALGKTASRSAHRKPGTYRYSKTASPLRMAALSGLLLLLSVGPGHAQQGPFTALSGSWSGGGIVTLSNGSRDRLRCRADYSARGGGDSLDLTLRCAGDAYNFDFRGNARHRAGTISGSWTESSMSASGRFIGRASGGNIAARVQGANFTASLSITTHADRQSISIRSPGSEFSDVSIGLRRR